MIVDLKQRIYQQIEELGGNPDLVQIVDYLFEKMTSCSTDSPTGQLEPVM